MGSFRKSFEAFGTTYNYCDIVEFFDKNKINSNEVPFCIKVLLENILRNCGEESALGFISHSAGENEDFEFSFKPSRVLMQDFTGVPAIVDLAAMRDHVQKIGKDPTKINPICKTDLVIDHSIQVDKYGNLQALKQNELLEFERNKERYAFLKWAQTNFANLNIVPPGKGICHQVNIEYLANIVSKNEKNELFFDTLVGTDSHTTMVNGLGVLGWGVGGIEAEAVMLGQQIPMIKPQVIGVNLSGIMSKSVSAMDVTLYITNVLRNFSVVGKFVEFFGHGVSSLSLQDRATIANMTPEFGATCGIFLIDEKTIEYLELTNRSKEQIEIIRQYCTLQGIFGVKNAKYDHIINIDLSEIQTNLAGPKNPHDRVALQDVPSSFVKNFGNHSASSDLNHGSVVIASITSCTNTSNPRSLITAGLFAKNAVKNGIKVPKFVKTSFSPGSLVVSEYMEKSGLQNYFNELGFCVAGFGCMTCIGNSGPLLPEIEKEIIDKKLAVSAVISGNRNFEGRVHNLVKSNYLASPMMVIAYALAGNVLIDFESYEFDTENGKIKLKDLMPDSNEIDEIMTKFINRELFAEKYKDIFTGNELWQQITTPKEKIYSWPKSCYIQNPPYFEKNADISDIKNAKILGVFGDFVTTDHISPAGNISIKSEAAKYLIENNIEYKEFNSYGARRGAHKVMMRGTFGNVRIKNFLLDIEGSFAKNSKGEIVSFYQAAMENQQNNVPSIIFAGQGYGCGSSRDWAAKGTKLLGIKAVVANSFERIHRSNLAGMGVLPIEIKEHTRDLDLKNAISVDIIGISKDLQAKSSAKCIISYQNKSVREIKCVIRLDTKREMEYFKQGSIFHYIVNCVC